MKIIVTSKEVYGRKLYYPACDISRAVFKAFRVKSISSEQIDNLIKANISVKMIREEEKTCLPET